MNPATVLHAVARKRFPGGRVFVDSFLPAASLKVDLIHFITSFLYRFHVHIHCSSDVKNAECMKEVEEARLQVSRFLQSQNQSTGRRRYVTPPQQIAAFNRFFHLSFSPLHYHGPDY